MIRLKTFLIFASLILMTAFAMQAQEELGTTSQPLVGGPTVDQQTRRELGLLTLYAPAPAPSAPGTMFPGPVSSTKTCSASLLNDNWAITASHCIDAATAPEQVTLEADWSGEKGKVTRKVAKIRSFQWTNNLDVALLMIVYPFPRHPSVKYPELSYRATSDLMDQRIESFGRGISGLAFQSGSNPMPAQSDGLYRSSDFEVFETSESHFTYRSVQGAGRAIAGGDSGGPSYFRVWDDPESPNRQIVRLLAGVHSNCLTQCLAGQKCGASEWIWVTNIPQCTDASVEPILNEIRTQMAFIPEKPFEERKPIDRDVIVAKPDIATAPSKSDIKIMTKASSFETRPNPIAIKALTTTAPNFSGTWATVTAAGSNYTMTLTQNGEIVSGQYVSADGAYKGVINGNVSDRTLIYQWSQQDGQKGTGKFTLSADGSKFEGWWTYSDDPNVVEVSWNGIRQ